MIHRASFVGLVVVIVATSVLFVVLSSGPFSPEPDAPLEEVGTQPSANEPATAEPTPARVERVSTSPTSRVLVVDSLGHPVPHVSVGWVSEHARFVARSSDLQLGETNVDGSLGLPSKLKAPEGFGSVGFYKRGWLTKSMALPLRGPVVRVVLERGYDLSLTCKDRRGKAVEGLKLIASKSALPVDLLDWSASLPGKILPAGSPSKAIHSAVTSEHGVAVFPGLAAQRYHVRPVSENYVLWQPRGFRVHGNSRDSLTVARVFGVAVKSAEAIISTSPVSTSNQAVTIQLLSSLAMISHRAERRWPGVTLRLFVPRAVMPTAEGPPVDLTLFVQGHGVVSTTALSKVLSQLEAEKLGLPEPKLCTASLLLTTPSQEGVSDAADPPFIVRCRPAVRPAITFRIRARAGAWTTVPAGTIEIKPERGLHRMPFEPIAFDLSAGAERRVEVRPKPGYRKCIFRYTTGPQARSGLIISIRGNGGKSFSGGTTAKQTVTWLPIGYSGTIRVRGPNMREAKSRFVVSAERGPFELELQIEDGE